MNAQLADSSAMMADAVIRMIVEFRIECLLFSLPELGGNIDVRQRSLTLPSYRVIK